MEQAQDEFVTADTPLAAYLVSEGFKLLLIRYEGKKGFFVFQDDPLLGKVIHGFNRGEAVGNIVLYEHARNKLIDRLKRGLP